MSESFISSRSINDFGWLLARDRSFVFAVVFFVVPGVLVAFSDFPESWLLMLGLLERVGQLWAMARVYQHAASFLAEKRVLKVTPRYLLVGILVELVLFLSLISLVSAQGWGAIALGVAVALMVRFWLNFLLYPMPLLDTRLTDWRAVLVSCRSLTQRVRLRDLFLWPAAIVIIVSGLAYAPYPDGRLWWSLPLAQAAAGFAHLVLVYRGAAATMLAIGAPPVDAVRARFGSPLLLVVAGCLLWSANIVRLVTLEPAPTIQVIGLQPAIDGSVASSATVIATIEVTDERFGFRGFSPERFYIGGATGFPVTGPGKIIRTESVSNVRRVYDIEFASERSIRDLSELTDLYLWYTRAKVAPVNIPAPSTGSSASIEPDASR